MLIVSLQLKTPFWPRIKKKHSITNVIRNPTTYLYFIFGHPSNKMYLLIITPYFIYKAIMGSDGGVSWARGAKKCRLI